MEAALRFITVLLIFVFVLFITHYTTRFVGLYQKGKYGGGRIKLLEAVRLNNNTYLQIVRAGDRYMVLAVSKDNVSMLFELTEEEYVQMGEDAETEQPISVPDFKELLQKAQNAVTRKKS